MPPPARKQSDKSLNQILTASKSSLVTAGKISNTNMYRDILLIDGDIDFDYSKTITKESFIEQ